MKKNVMMRLASFLLVAVLISTSAISGTYAKYVTEASSDDAARVAKWGVTVAIDGSSLFANQYANGASDVTVKSLDAQKVVAPGTSSAESEAMRFKVTGQPEVDVELKFDFTNVQDIYLKAGTYTDYTEATGYEAADPVYGKTFTIADDYYPVVFTLSSNSGVLATGKLTEIAEYLAGAGVSKVYENGTVLDSILGGTNGEYTLTWEWIFNGNDKADTLLGNLMVDPSIVDSSKYNLSVGYELTISATQVD